MTNKEKNPIRVDSIAKLTTEPSKHRFDAHFIQLSEEDLNTQIVLDSINNGYLTNEEATIGNWCYNDSENYVGMTTLQKWADRTNVPEDMRSKDQLILETLQKLSEGKIR